MEWEAPAIVLAVRPFGEGDAIATVMTEAHGLHRGLARGAQARLRAALWQPGNLVQLRWVGRLADQLGSFSAEMVHPTAALALDDALALAMLTAACAVAEGALPEREPHPRVFDGLLHLLARLAQGPSMLDALIRWEADLLTDLGYGLDLARCAVTGSREDLAFVSPRSGCAVSEAGAGQWRERLLPLPTLLLGQAPGTARDWRDGLRLTGHFLARDVFGLQHKPLPPARLRLPDLLPPDPASPDPPPPDPSGAATPLP
ncbi:MAG: DNA repair protein RecO [Rhodospirillales bacterium]|nr:DNA repair protein RecO [Rhodospirillales bacterium]